MHSAVLQNRKYIQFADQNTVEVIALAHLGRGIAANDPKAATYEAKDADGNPVEYLLEYPGLTANEMLALAQSDARKYNKTGKIPYTSIVDPHSLEEIEGWLGGQSAKTIMEGVVKATRALRKEHGAGVDRKDIRALDTTVAEAKSLAAESDFDKAMKTLEKAEKKLGDLPRSILGKIEETRRVVIRAAESELESLESRARIDPDAARSELTRRKRSFRGTGLEDRIDKILENISG